MTDLQAYTKALTGLCASHRNDSSDNRIVNILCDRINNETQLADGWNWSSTKASWISTRPNWRQLSYVEYWNTYRPLQFTTIHQ